MPSAGDAARTLSASGVSLASPAKQNSAPNTSFSADSTEGVSYTSMQVKIFVQKNGACEPFWHFIGANECRLVTKFQKCQYAWFLSTVLPGIQLIADVWGVPLKVRTKYET